MLNKITVSITVTALMLSACVTNPTTGQQTVSKSALYGGIGAVTCGLIGAMTNGGKGARNSALALVAQ